MNKYVNRINYIVLDWETLDKDSQIVSKKWLLLGGQGNKGPKCGILKKKSEAQNLVFSF
jgi:hypothetical protein